MSKHTVTWLTGLIVQTAKDANHISKGGWLEEHLKGYSDMVTGRVLSTVNWLMKLLSLKCELFTSKIELNGLQKDMFSINYHLFYISAIPGMQDKSS